MAKNDFRLTSNFKIIIIIFCLNKEELIQQVYLIKYVENRISNSTSHKNKGKKERSKNIIQLQKHRF